MEKIKYDSDTQAMIAFVEKYNNLKTEIAKIIVGQDEIVDKVLISIFSNSHALLVGVPGLAKTLLINTISQALDLSYKRIQFTPDLMPSDILGSEILDDKRQFKFNKGPIFSNIILADEINRTPPKTQAALLEAMQEKNVTIAGETYKLDEPFFVLATQNPIEQEGTYPLPEAQLDRFIFNVFLDYPKFEEEINIVKNTTIENPHTINPVMSKEEIIYFQKLMSRMPVADNIFETAVKIVSKTRPNTPLSSEICNKYINWGAGPRASQYLIIGAKTHAAIKGKYSPDLEDIKTIAHSVLRHRLVVNYKAEADGYKVDNIIDELLK